MSNLLVAVTLKLFDQMGGALMRRAQEVQRFSESMQRMNHQAQKFAQSSLIDAAAVGYPMLKTVQAFAELESASTRLESTMMGATGAVSKNFQNINDLAVKLGNELPGTAADFINMMSKLKEHGITDQSILGGVGEAAARFAVLMKMAPDAAAEFAAKMKKATGTADGDMIKLMDTLQKVKHLGVDVGEMMFSFSRSAGTQKLFQIQGVDKAKELAALYSMFIELGSSGETVGTGLGSMMDNVMNPKRMDNVNRLLAMKGIKLEFLDGENNFKGVENLVAQFAKLQKLDLRQQQYILHQIFGGGFDQKMASIMVLNGVDGLKKQVARLDEQASLNQRVNKQLGTLANMWDAASGNFTNMMASFGKVMEPQLKGLVQWFGNMSNAVDNFIKLHPTLAKWMGISILAFVGMAAGLGTLGLIVAVVTRYLALIGPVLLFMGRGAMWAAGALRMLVTYGGMIWNVIRALAVMFAPFGQGLLMFFVAPLRLAGTAVLWLGRALLLNPIGAIITAIAVAAYLIYKYWGPIKTFFKGLWEGIVSIFTQSYDKLAHLIDRAAALVPDWMKPNGGGIGGAASRGPSTGSFGPAAPSAAPGANNQVSGTIKIEFDQNGQPRVRSVASNNPRVGFNVDAGYIMRSN